MTLVERGASTRDFSVGLAHISAKPCVCVIFIVNKMINARPRVDPNNSIRRAMSASVCFEHEATSNKRNMDGEAETEGKANSCKR